MSCGNIFVGAGADATTQSKRVVHPIRFHSWMKTKGVVYTFQKTKRTTFCTQFYGEGVVDRHYHNSSHNNNYKNCLFSSSCISPNCHNRIYLQTSPAQPWASKDKEKYLSIPLAKISSSFINCVLAKGIKAIRCFVALSIQLIWFKGMVVCETS